MVLYLFANVNFFPDKYNNVSEPPGKLNKPDSHKQKWQAAYDELAKYVEAKELTTLTYYFGLPFEYAKSPSDTTLMFAFEAYGERKDLYETHFHSAAMKKFLAEVPAYMST
jgi:quinol monooxygenase YgiN